MALFQEFAGSLSQFMEPAMNTFATGLLKSIATDYSIDLDEITGRYLSKAGDAKWAPNTVKIDLNTPAVIATTQTEITAEAEATRAPRRKKSVEKVDKAMCEGLTAKGTPCKNKAKGDQCLCHIHLRKKEKDESGEPAAPKKSRKAKKVDPVHTHLIQEEPEAEEGCAVCDAHGDVGVEECDEPEFDVDQDIQTRLAAILAGEESDEEDDEEDDDDQPDQEVAEVMTKLVEEAEDQEDQDQEDDQPETDQDQEDEPGTDQEDQEDQDEEDQDEWE